MNAEEISYAHSLIALRGEENNNLTLNSYIITEKSFLFLNFLLEKVVSLGLAAVAGELWSLHKALQQHCLCPV